MVISRLLGLIFRIGELISAVIVAGIIGHYLNIMDNAHVYPGSRFIYTEVVAGLTILLSIILLIPFTWALTAFPADLLMFLLWIVSFGLLVDYIAPMNCTWYVGWYPTYPGANAPVDGWPQEIYSADGRIRYTNYSNNVDQCSTWKTALAFTFISAMLWLASAFLAIWVVTRVRRSRDPTVRRRAWYQSHYV